MNLRFSDAPYIQLVLNCSHLSICATLAVKQIISKCGEQTEQRMDLAKMHFDTVSFLIFLQSRF